MSKFSNIRTPAPKTPARVGGGNGGLAPARGGRSGDRANYMPLTVYIDRPVYQAFKVQLAFEQLQFSEVLTDLMRQWVERKRPTGRAKI